MSAISAVRLTDYSLDKLKADIIEVNFNITHEFKENVCQYQNITHCL